MDGVGTIRVLLMMMEHRDKWRLYCATTDSFIHDGQQKRFVIVIVPNHPEDVVAITLYDPEAADWAFKTLCRESDGFRIARLREQTVELPLYYGVGHEAWRAWLLQSFGPRLGFGM